MRNSSLTFLISLIVWLTGQAQTLPAPGAKLNYTQVMFEYEQVKGVPLYIIQLAEDIPGSSFERCLITQKDSSTATMISGLEFGKKYKWRYAGITGSGPLGWHGPYHFEIVEDTLLKLNPLSLKVSVNDSANQGGLIINDASYIIYDRMGRPVWYLPQRWQFKFNRLSNDPKNPRYKLQQMDVLPRCVYLSLNPYGTITYFSDSSIIESDLDGNKLWQKHFCSAPSEMGENAYNHAFMRMPNGHYITLGNEMVRRMPPHLDSLGQIKYPQKDTINGIAYASVEFGTVLEYDKKGDLVWSWNSEDYFDRYGSVPKDNMTLQAHVNALSVDRNNEFVYVGFRNINRIVKVEKRTGQVVDSWGPHPGPGDSIAGATVPKHDLYIYRQHNADILDDGTVLIYNNNDYPNTDSLPSVVIFSQRPESDGQVVWKYYYELDTPTRHIGRIGGSAQQLKNGNILVCTGTPNHIFEVTRDKKIVWQAVMKSNDNIPDVIYHYRLCSAYNISSLYPCYFTFQTDRDTITKSSPKFNLRIFNEGSENDSYDVKLSSITGEVVAQFRSDTISPGRSVTMPVTLPADSRKIEIAVSSKTNPDLLRKAEVVIIE